MKNETQFIYMKDSKAHFYFVTEISDNIKLKDDGCLYCYNVIMGRTGKQQYLGSEIGVSDKNIVDVDRLEEDVFHPETLDSIVGKPVTLYHPDEDVTIDNIREYGKGVILDARRDGDNIVGTIKIEDMDLIDKIIKKEIRDLSLGYQCVIDQDEYGNYKQTNIIVNHLAVVPQGRAGNARIVDNSSTEVKEKTKMTFFEKIFGSKKVKSLVLDDGSKVELEHIEDEVSQNEETLKVEETPKEEIPVNVDDGYVEKRETVTKETFESEYGKTTTITKVETETVREDKDENGNIIKEKNVSMPKIGDEQTTKEKENTMEFTLKDAMVELKELEPLKGTEAYDVAVKALDAKCQDAKLGSILPKGNEEEENVFKTVKPTSKQIIDSKEETFNPNAFMQGLQKMYDGMSGRNLAKISIDPMVQAQEITKKSSYDAQDFIGGK